jgi:hypothetical protein
MMVADPLSNNLVNLQSVIATSYIALSESSGERPQRIALIWWLDQAVIGSRENRLIIVAVKCKVASVASKACVGPLDEWLFYAANDAVDHAAVANINGLGLNGFAVVGASLAR